MKKIKFLLLFGFLTLFGIGKSFGYSTYFQTFFDSSNNSLSSFSLFTMPSNAGWWYKKCRGLNSVSSSDGFDFSNCEGWNGSSMVNSNGQDIFYSFGGLNGGFIYSIGGNGYLTDGNVSKFFVGSNFTYGSIKNSQYPLILNTQDGKYLTFENENTIAYNGQDYTFPSNSLLKSCFYGVGESVSCVLSNGTFINISFYIDNNVYYNSGFLVIPIHNLNNQSFTGNSTLLIAVDTLNDDRIIYNIVDSYSSNISELENSNIISAGYSMLNLSTFISKSFMNFNFVPSSYTGRFINTFYIDGYFIDFPFYGDGEKYFFYSNTKIPYFRSGNLLLIQDFSVGSVFDLNNGGGGNQPIYSGNVSSNNCIDTQVCYDTTGDNGEVFHICTSRCIDSGSIISGSYIGSDGTIYYVDSSYNIGNISNLDGTIYDTGFLNEDGLLSIDYYSGLFNGNGFRFGICPYPSSNYLDFATKIKIGNFYPFMPLNCYISAFQQGFKVHYFDEAGLFPDNNSQLFTGDSHNHKILFRFFDILLSIGILLVMSALLRIIKK